MTISEEFNILLEEIKILKELCKNLELENEDLKKKYENSLIQNGYRD